MSSKLPILGMCGVDIPILMYARYNGIVYTPTVVFIQGQSIPSLVLDPRTPTPNTIIFNEIIPGFHMKITSSGNTYNIGYKNNVLDITDNTSLIVPITTQANDFFYISNRYSVLSSVAYTMFYNNKPIAFNAYKSNGEGGIVVNGQGVAEIQQIVSDLYFFPVNWYPINNCSTPINDFAFINQTILNWLRTGTLPSTQYFSIQDQCNIGNPYKYCQYNTYCTAQCFGPCNNGQSCTYNKGNNAYYCPNITPTCNNTAFIVAIVGLILLLCILLALFLLR